MKRKNPLSFLILLSAVGLLSTNNWAYAQGIQDSPLESPESATPLIESKKDESRDKAEEKPPALENDQEIKKDELPGHEELRNIIDKNQTEEAIKLEENQDKQKSEGKAKTVSPESSKKEIQNDEEEEEANSRPIKRKRRRMPVIKSFDDYVQDFKYWSLTSGVHILLIFIAGLIAIKFTNVLSTNIFNLVTKNKEGTELKKRASTLRLITRYVMIFSIIGIGGMMILKKLGVDIGPLLAGAGVVGIAVGFGAQNLVKDLISGALILVEDQIRVGDVVKIGDKRGTVEKVTLRMVVLRDVSGNVHYIPSGDISIVTNMTKTYSRYLFDVGVAYKEDTDEVIAAMKEVDSEIREEEKFKEMILSDLEIMGVQRFEASAVIIRARTKTQPGKQWKVGREYNRRFKKKFEEKGIEIPFPHVTVYPGTGRETENPAFNLQVQSDELSSRQ